ncbi:hypothetical protein SAMN05660706_14016 [Desulfoscipio geothermicus DSM 3669]|uniref:Uncharacterized protein n=1 Tax=Desulfoscipio geothermicus DSM 3669 TaxID=1121426 RepID=A0A1I6EFH0_9FIRM|nr:hypothetical protein SAMN05660706_14016 [Desulfoscipio geothermicus DSM 3669]
MLVHFFNNPSGKGKCRILIRIGQNNNKFISSIASHHIGYTGSCFNQLGHVTEYKIPAGVPAVIIDLLN